MRTIGDVMKFCAEPGVRNGFGPGFEAKLCQQPVNGETMKAIVEEARARRRRRQMNTGR